MGVRPKPSTILLLDGDLKLYRREGIRRWQATFKLKSRWVRVSTGHHDCGSARKAGMAPPSSGILPPLGPGLHLADQHGGTLAVGGKVHAGGRTGHFDDIVGCGFVLLTRTADPGLALSPENAAFWRDVGGIVVGFGTGAPLDTEGTYGRWFAELDADAVLIRPDFYVFAATRGTDAANDLVTALAARV